MRTLLISFVVAGLVVACGVNTEPIPGDADMGFRNVGGQAGAGGELGGGGEPAGFGGGLGSGPDAGAPGGPADAALPDGDGVPAYAAYAGCDTTLDCDDACVEDLDCGDDEAGNPIQANNEAPPPHVRDLSVVIDQDEEVTLEAGGEVWFDLGAREGHQSFHAASAPDEGSLTLVVYDGDGAVLGRSALGEVFVVISLAERVEQAWLRVVSSASDTVEFTLDQRQDPVE